MLTTAAVAPLDLGQAGVLLRGALLILVFGLCGRRGRGGCVQHAGESNRAVRVDAVDLGSCRRVKRTGGGPVEASS